MMKFIPFALLFLAVSANAAVLQRPGAQRDVADYGAAPAASAAVNFTAFTNALANALTVTISQTGVFNLNAPLYLKDNQTLVGHPKAILRKAIAYSHVFANEGSRSNGTVTNINITLRDIVIDDNQNQTTVGAAALTANGELQFTFVHGLLLDNVTVTNTTTTLFGIHLQSVENAVVRKYKFSGEKDGFHIQNGCRNILVDGFDISSFDDAFGVLADDYPSYQHRATDIVGITLRNGVSRKRASQAGYFMRSFTGSWTNWLSGNSYNIGHCTLNAGNIYKKTDAGNDVGTTAPVHTSGDSTGADGITWRWIGAGTHYTANVRDITVDNVLLECGRNIYRTVSADANDNSEYPGTLYTSTYSGINLSRIRWTTNTPTLFFEDAGQAGSIVISDITVGTEQVVANQFVYLDATARAESILLRNITTRLTNNATPFVYLVTGTKVGQLTLENPNIIGLPDWSLNDTSFIRNMGNSLSNLTIIGGTLSYLPTIHGGQAGGVPTNSISVYGTRFIQPNRVLYLKDALANVTASFYGCVFDEPQQTLFDNDNANATLKINVLGSRFLGSYGKVYGANVTPGMVEFGDRFSVGATALVITNGVISVGSGSAAAASASLDIVSTTKGALMPRMTKAQRDAIGSPADGLIIYQTDGTAGLHIREGGAWNKITSAADP